MSIRTGEHGATTEKRDDAGLSSDAAPCPNPELTRAEPLAMMMAPESPMYTDPWSVSHQFAQAAEWLREQAPEIATGSRDFGRGFMLAARMLEAESGAR